MPNPSKIKICFKSLKFAESTLEHFALETFIKNLRLHIRRLKQTIIEVRKKLESQLLFTRRKKECIKKGLITNACMDRSCSTIRFSINSFISYDESLRKKTNLPT